MIRQLGAAVLLGLAVAVAGCSTDDTPTSSGGNTSRTVKADPSFANDIQEIFNRRGCSGSSCHGSAQSAGLDLRTGNAYGELVGVTATESGLKRVEAGDAAASYLVVKVEGTQTTGDQMPLGGQPLDATDLQNIKNWVNQGAKNN